MSDTKVLKTVAIVSTPGVLGGKPRIDGRRISVMHVAEHFNAGWPVDEICEAFRLSPAEVYAALSYYYDHREEIDAALDERRALASQIEAVRKESPEKYTILDAVMTVPAVAAEFNLSNRTVRDAIEHGWIEAVKSGGTWLIRRTDAEARWGDRKTE